MTRLKRTLHITPEQGMSMAKRMRVVERRTLANRPEMRTITFRLNPTLAAAGTTGDLVNAVVTNIQQGSNTNERTGNEIRVWRLEVRGLLDRDCDCYVTQLHTTSEPTRSIFGTGQGSFLLDNENNTRFTEWALINTFNVTSKGIIRKVVKFKGMRVHYNGVTSTSGIKNQICVTLKNNADTTNPQDISVRLWYTDA